jgi:hypothetical protein
MGKTILVLVLLIGGFLYYRNGEIEKCKTRGSEKSVSYFPYNDYPDTSERARLQSNYSIEYEKLNCPSDYSSYLIRIIDSL